MLKWPHLGIECFFDVIIPPVYTANQETPSYRGFRGETSTYNTVCH